MIVRKKGLKMMKGVKMTECVSIVVTNLVFGRHVNKKLSLRQLTTRKIGRAHV